MVLIKISFHQDLKKDQKKIQSMTNYKKLNNALDEILFAETKNTVYPELMKWMPPFLVKRDITIRNPSLICIYPLADIELNGTKNNSTPITNPTKTLIYQLIYVILC